jgi:hypothetical protein
MSYYVEYVFSTVCLFQFPLVDTVLFYFSSIEETSIFVQVDVRN